MNLDKKLIGIYTLLGVVLGVVSNYFSSLIYQLAIPLAVYLISFFILIRYEKSKKPKWLFYNSFLTFLLVWFMVWILLYNL